MYLAVAQQHLSLAIDLQVLANGDDPGASTVLTRHGIPQGPGDDNGEREIAYGDDVRPAEVMRGESGAVEEHARDGAHVANRDLHSDAHSALRLT